MSILPISNIINVTITTTPQGLATPNVNNVALFTNEAPSNGDIYRLYTSASEVASDYGTNSVTAAMANAAFGQNPNILSGSGQLVILPLLSSVSATSGSLTTANISTNLSSIIAVTNGDIKFTINSVVYNLLHLNFTGCVTWADVARVIQTSLPDGTVVATANGFSVTSKKVGSTTSVAITAATGGTGTALNGSGYFNGASATTAAGTNSSGETIAQAITRTGGVVPYVGVMTNLNLEDAVVVTTGTAVQAQDRIFIHHAASTQDITGLALTISQASLTRTRILTYTLFGQAEANLEKAGYVGRGFSVNFTGSQTSQTMNLKSLAGFLPDTNINQTLWSAANVNGTDLYVSYAGVPAVLSTGGNDFFDNPYSDLALKFALETAGFNYLRQTNTKVPQTEQGMNGLKAAYANIMNQFVRNGCFAPGSWTSSETFGDPETFRNNIINNGFYIYSLPITQQNAAERDARIAPLVQIAAKRAGAIHEGDVLVLINN